MHQQLRRAVPLGDANFLSILEGLTGGFAVFAGIIVGLYFQDISHDLLITTALIGLIVSAFNASAVRYGSEHYLDELDGHEKRHVIRAYFVPALIEFLTYAIVSLLATLPLLLLRDTLTAVLLCTLMTILILFAAGFYRGKLLGRHAVRDGFETSLLGILIISVGAAAGWIIADLVA